MAEELFDIFDEKMNHIGIKERKEVHKNGYWHKSFHCWFYQIEDDNLYVLFQKRQHDKDTHPNSLDITAAGHLTSGEEPEDGIREVEEELGIPVKMSDLEWIDIIPVSYAGDTFLDREFCYTYLYSFEQPLSVIIPDIEEVSGIYKIPFQLLTDLFKGTIKSITIEGYEYLNDVLASNQMEVKITDFVPHSPEYYDIIFEKLSKILSKLEE
ncbi:NUDIX domain-containing protein [Bacillus sp. FJAT-49736]|uniref:NUDIX hydrolase n=1 Tax=Bacillus sp. FJAT-49736 TaxID=2833582 RepID=UPI001BCA274E|nr:NUDIX domain-containing protein [Bacillus sp. FJAT-49736]MBS4174013.1 NUDIX domain-containing protein [Bacillus sp. FJAT-49736]